MLFSKKTWYLFRYILKHANTTVRRYAPWLSAVIYFFLGSIVRKIDTVVIKKTIASYESGRLYEDDECFITFCQKPYTCQDKQPLVTVIVPNYNHAAYLKKRLDSIYQQTYQNFEVLLLDDCSTDDSRNILNKYLQENSGNTRLIVNAANSGGVFHQWEKGIKLAKGDLVWIAESDDYCSENFLESMVRHFNDEAVMLSYARTVFVKGESCEQIWTIEEYLSDIDKNKWRAPFVQSANELVRDAWSINNIVPNVSGAVFRNPKNAEILSDSRWKNMRICGDWVFYLSIIRGGLVVYTTESTNYYRIHDKNTSVNTYAKDIYYEEHEYVAKIIAGSYKVNSNVFERQKNNLIAHWRETRGEFERDEFERCYSTTRIINGAVNKPNLMLAGYSFAAGGGETFPIQLANLFKSRGYSVTYLSCEQDEREPGVRTMLRADIPVVTNLEYLNGIVEHLGIDVIHSHHAWVDNSILDLLPENSACKTVVSLHGMYEMIEESDKKQIIERMYKRAGKIVYTADKNVAPFKLCGYFDDKHFVKIDNALSHCDINPIDRNELGISPDAFVLCLVSRAIADKGWREAIEVVSRAREMSGSDIQLIMIGEGPEYDALKSTLLDYVHFLGFKKNIRDYYAASNLGFLPSRFAGESFPLTIIDCLQSGVPVLASDKGEIHNMLSMDGKVAGYVFALENGEIPIDEVAQVVVKYVSDPARYEDSKLAVADIVKKFDPELMADRYESEYLKLVRQT